MKRIFLLSSVLSLVGFAAMFPIQSEDKPAKKQPVIKVSPSAPEQPTGPVERTDEEWKKILTPEQYRILRQEGTERANGEVYEEFKKHGGGTYYCAGCDAELFTSNEKFDSHCGWPSFYDPAKAKNVIVIFCAGAVSQLETWDYKPELIEWDDKPLPGGPAVTFQGPSGNLARPQYPFRQRGDTGKWVSDMIPHLAELTDDFAFVHSLTSLSNTHGPAENFLSTGFVLDGFPSLGSWATYALGSESRDLPSYVAIPDPRGVPQNGANNWGPGFLPAALR